MSFCYPRHCHGSLNFRIYQFIDCLTQETAWANHTQLSRSRMCCIQAKVHKGNGSIVLVDTPGFNGDMNPAILQGVYDWLRQKSVTFNNLTSDCNS